MKIRTVMLAVPFVMAFATAGYAAGSEEQVKWADVPAAVQKTATDSAAGAKIGATEKEIKDGKTIYEVKAWKDDHTKLIIKVDDTGKLIETKTKAEEMVPFASVPEAVQKTFTDNLGGEKVTEVEKEMKHGKLDYEAKVRKSDGSKTIIEVGEDGKLIGVKQKKDDYLQPKG